MKKTLAILGVLTIFPVAALADDDCFVPMTDWQPRDVVAEHARENGWTPHRIKVDDGCYEIEGVDAEGHEIEVKLHPKTLEVIEFEYEDDEHRERERDQDHEGLHDDGHDD